MRKQKRPIAIILLALFVMLFTSCAPEVTTYTVTFMNEGNVYHTATVIAGQTVGEITAPQAEEGKEFSFWSADGNTQFNFSSPINSNITLYAVWENLTYEITFYVNDEVYESVSVISEDQVTQPDNPEPIEEGKVFWYWSCEGEEYDFSTPVTADLSLYAMFADSTHNVTFVNGSWTSSPQIVEHDTPVEKPEDPTSSDVKIRFYHWSLTENGEEAYDFSSPITSDITLFAVWGENRHNVTFVNGGWNSIVSVLNTETVSPISDPEPIEEGDVFSHWSSTEYGEAFDFATPITEDMTLYAVWKPVVTYVNGTEITKVTYEYGATLTQPENPTTVPEGKRTFSHWSEEDGGLTEYEFNSVVLTKDKTLYAVWTDYQVRIVNLDETISAYDVISGTTIAKPETPDGQGREFLYWGTTNWGNEYDFTTPVNSDITLYAVYNNHKVTLINGSTETIYPCYVGEALQKPDDPEAVEDWQGDFFFWSEADRNQGETELFGTVIDKDIVLYAIWMPKGITYSTNYENKLQITDYDNSYEEIVIPYGVEVIGNNAFYYCDKLKIIFLPDSIANIENSAFRDCSSLENIDIPKGVTSIGNSTFWGCRALKSIDIPDGVTSIGNYSFRGCSSLISIDIPEGVTSIGDSAFESCSSLTSIKIPDGVTTIGSYVFFCCNSLESIDIPESVMSIGDYAFYNTGLQNIEIPEGVTSIGAYAFYSCFSLENIKIPNSVTTIGSHAFSDCSLLESIDIPDGVTTIGGDTFSGCSLLESVNIPEGVTIIASGMFRYCRALNDIHIPEGVTSIGFSAFFGCRSLTSIEIPESVENIDSTAFSECPSLSTITIDNTENAILGSPWGATNATVIWSR